jgi:putative membrane protein
MPFLKTLFWVIVAVVLVLFAQANWDMVTIDLWGGLQADVKLPVLVIGAFLLGFLPTYILYRSRVWSLKRRLEIQNQARVANAPGAVTTGASAPSRGEPARNVQTEAERPVA